MVRAITKNPSNFFARFRYTSSAATATASADALMSTWHMGLVRPFGGRRRPPSMLARGQSTVRSVAPSSARSQASYVDASISSVGCVLGGLAPAAAPCTSGRAFGSTRASASSEATTRARRRFCLSSRQRYRRSHRDSSIDAGSPTPVPSRVRHVGARISGTALGAAAAAPSRVRPAPPPPTHHRSPAWGRPSSAHWSALSRLLSRSACDLGLAS